MIRESEERYRRTVNNMSEGLVVYSGDGTVQLCNPAAQEIMGLSKEQFIGEMPIDPHWHAMHEDGSPFPIDTHPVFKTLKTGEAQTNIIMGVHKPDGRMTWTLINTQPLRDPQNDSLYAVVTTFADITERKNAEHTLQSALKQEQELGELKSRFVSIASHEFRTPLAGILATTETLLKFRDRMDEGQINSRLDRIREKVVHMEDIMNDVLQLARIQAGRVEYKPVPANLDAVCREIIEEFEFRAQNGARIQHNLDDAVVPAVFDKHLMRRIITNLVSNALKYSGDNPISITLKKLDSQIMLQVSDQGIGIPEEDLKHIFEPFHRASNIGTIPGTGLGMSIVKQAVELHGGSITVESQVGSGAIFTVTIPVQSKPSATQESMQVKQ
jgi:PAS domain S-box-containing protein